MNKQEYEQFKQNQIERNEDYLNIIFDIATKQEYDQETIDAYEEKYKTFVLEMLADYCEFSESHLDEDESVEDVKVYWNNIFHQIKLHKGKYEVYDCFHRFIGTIDSRPLADILNIGISGITYSIGRNTYLRTLKIQK